MKRLRLFMITFAAMVIAAACTRTVEHAPLEPKVSYGQASDSIANTVCAHQQRCGEIAVNEFAECVGDVTEEAVDELDPDECDEGFLQAQLDGCLSVVNATECGDSVEVDDLDACSAHVLCEI